MGGKKSGPRRRTTYNHRRAEEKWAREQAYFKARGEGATAVEAGVSAGLTLSSMNEYENAYRIYKKDPDIYVDKREAWLYDPDLLPKSHPDSSYEPKDDPPVVAASQASRAATLAAMPEATVKTSVVQAYVKGLELKVKLLEEKIVLLEGLYKEAKSIAAAAEERYAKYRKVYVELRKLITGDDPKEE